MENYTVEELEFLYASLIQKSGKAENLEEFEKVCQQINDEASINGLKLDAKYLYRIKQAVESYELRNRFKSSYLAKVAQFLGFRNFQQFLAIVRKFNQSVPDELPTSAQEVTIVYAYNDQTGTPNKLIDALTLKEIDFEIEVLSKAPQEGRISQQLEQSKFVILLLHDSMKVDTISDELKAFLSNGRGFLMIPIELENVIEDEIMSNNLQDVPHDLKVAFLAVMLKQRLESDKENEKQSKERVQHISNSIGGTNNQFTGGVFAPGGTIEIKGENIAHGDMTIHVNK